MKHITACIACLGVALLFVPVKSEIVVKQKNSAASQSKPKTTPQKDKTPPAFGKTHFIVGYPHEKIKHNKKETKRSDLVTANGSIRRALFSPDDNIQKTLEVHSQDLLKRQAHLNQ